MAFYVINGRVFEERDGAFHPVTKLESAPAEMASDDVSYNSGVPKLSHMHLASGNPKPQPESLEGQVLDGPPVATEQLPNVSQSQRRGLAAIGGTRSEAIHQSPIFRADEGQPFDNPHVAFTGRSISPHTMLPSAVRPEFSAASTNSRNVFAGAPRRQRQDGLPHSVGAGVGAIDRIFPSNLGQSLGVEKTEPKSRSSASELLSLPRYFDKLQLSPLERILWQNRTMPVVPRKGWTQSQANPQDMKKASLGTKSGPYTEIVFHHTSTRKTPQSVYDLHVKGNGWADVGYHYMIDVDGTVYTGRDLAYEGAHVKGHNPGKIGIAFLGDYTSRPNTPEQLAASRQLVDSLTSRYKSINRLSNHGMYDPERVPEASMSANKYLEDVAIMKGLVWGRAKN